MLKFFRLPFAVSGDKTAVPDASQPSGSVSYEDGFGLDYELDPGVDPAAKDVPRDETNQLFYDITNAIAELQSFGTPDFITSALNGGVAYSYSKYARVKYSDGFVYVSKIDANTDLPTVAASWWKLTDNANYLTIDDAVFEASVANGEAVYWDSANNWFDEAVADGTTKQNMIGFADVTNGRVFVAGLYAGQLAGLAGNTAYYLSTVTPGALTSVVSPVAVGVAKSATDMYVEITKLPAASETVAGVAESASQAEVDAGTAGNMTVTPAKLRFGFASSLGSTGYIALPSWLGGWVVQWGNSSTVSGGTSLTFPLAFPTACYQIVVALRSGSVSPVTASANVPTTTGVGVYTSNTAGAGVTANFSWLAVGK